MTKLREKSEFNIDAASLLIANELYAPSIHCSYYSCFQLMKFALKDFMGIDYIDLEKNIIASKQHTHTFVITTLGKEIRKFDKNLFREFNNKIRDLKSFREKADYENIDIDIDKGQQAYQIANDIRKCLISNLHL